MTAPTCLIIHGVAGNGQENWFPWLKQVLEKHGWEVIVPDLPNPNHPNPRAWNESLATLIRGEGKLVIVGHSLGVPAAFNLIQLGNRKVDTMISVAPVNPQQDWKKLEEEIPDLDWAAVKIFANLKVDSGRINSLTNKLIFYYSDNDPYIPETSVNYYRGLFPQADFRLMKGKGHFNSTSGVKEFPELMEEILKI